MNLINQSEVISIAFNRKIAEAKISDSLIQAAQRRYIMPILGKDLYADVNTNPYNYSDLLLLIKQALAHWVKYMALPEIYVEIADTGVHTINANNAATVNDQRFIEVKEQIADIAKQHTLAITEYLNDSSIALYYAGNNPQNQVNISGGILFDAGINTDSEDDCGAKWRVNFNGGQTY